MRSRCCFPEALAQNIFNDNNCEIETILALDIPSIRAYMHLDTVCTQVDCDKFTIHPGISEEKSAIIPLYHREGHFGSPIPPKKTQEANVYAI